MRRTPRELQANAFDLLIVGGGVYGACLARLAARAGLGVALVEAGDFGAGVSRNSLKIVHGGFRYIQHLDLPRIRESVDSQRAWLGAAPHLVRPMRCVIPAYGHGARGPLIYAGGVVAYGLAALGRNRGLPARSRLPAAGVLSRDGILQRHPELARRDLTGGAWWYDAQMLDAGRLVLECLQDAAAHGAVVVNHVAAVAPLQSGRRVSGALLRDALTGEEYEARARLTVNAAGAHAAAWLGELGAPLAAPGARVWTRNVNLVTRRLFETDDAVGVGSQRPADSTVGKANRLFFVTSWRDRSIVGTSHVRHEGAPATLKASVGADVAMFLTEVGQALPALGLSAADILSVHSGLTPAEGDVDRAKRAQIVDHAAVHGIDGLLTVFGIKYTTAPGVARAVLRRALRLLGTEARPVSFDSPLPGAPAALPARAPWEADRHSEAAWAQWTYGERWSRLSAAVPRGELAEDEWIFRCRVRHGIAHEMVARLGDALFRATDLAERGLLDESRIDWTLAELASAQGWSAERQAAELAALRAALREDSVRVQPARGRSAA